MNERYVTKKVLTANVQRNSNGQNTGPASTFHWAVIEKASGAVIEEPFSGQAEAEDACLRLNKQRT